ncbi:hypothetical protein Btru_071150 [Bulinus truncatus]|nr:hypothetical protein Btru_071150 [Bulinus truncatus]
MSSARRRNAVYSGDGTTSAADINSDTTSGARRRNAVNSGDGTASAADINSDTTSGARRRNAVNSGDGTASAADINSDLHPRCPSSKYRQLRRYKDTQAECLWAKHNGTSYEQLNVSGGMFSGTRE